MADLRISHPPHVLALERREKQLQADLQALLDAQSDGLIAGLSGGAGDNASSDGFAASTPSTMSVRDDRGPLPSIKSGKRKLGLRAARRGILLAIRELADVKRDEGLAIGESMARDADFLRQIDDWLKKRAGLEIEIRHIDGAEEGRRLVRLRAQGSSLQAEITKLESRLSELRAQHRQVTVEVSRTENSIQANRSSYEASLAIVDAQVRDFLESPPATGVSHRRSKAPLMMLPPKRRTLELAKEHWEAELETCVSSLQQYDSEKEALEQGAHIWNTVVKEINTFEKMLRVEMTQLGNGAIHSSHSEATEATGKLEGMLSQMEGILSSVEKQYNFVEERGWKLLMCCIGAELQAFAEGRDILQSALEASRSYAGENTLVGTDKLDPLIGDVVPPDGSPLVDFHDARSNTEDEDEGPGPELLVSHHEED